MDELEKMQRLIDNKVVSLESIVDSLAHELEESRRKCKIYGNKGIEGKQRLKREQEYHARLKMIVTLATLVKK